MKNSAAAHLGLISWLCVMIGFALAVGLRLFVMTEPLWVDELHTAWVVDADVDQVFQRAAAGNQAPLFFWLTWFITKAFGTSIVSLRLLSLVSSLLLIALAARFVFKWTGSPAAVLSVVLLFAFDPLMVFYATEARPYGLLQLVGLIQMAVFWELWRTEARGDATPKVWGRVGLLSSCSAALFYLHYTASLLLATEAVFVLIGLCVQWRQKRSVFGTLSKFLTSLVLTVLLCVPTISHLRFVFERKDQWSGISSATNLLNELLLPLILSVGLPIAIGTLLWLSGQWESQDKKANRLGLLSLFLSCALVPIVIACLTDELGFLSLSHSRYVVVSLVAMFVFAAILIGSLYSSSWQWILAAIVLASNCLVNPMALSLVKTGELIPFRREYWESPIQQINELEKEEEEEEEASSPVFLLANLLEDREAATNHQTDYQAYLKFPVSGIYKIENVERVIPLNSSSDNPFTKSQVELIKGQGSAWILFRATRQHVRRLLSSLQTEFGGSLDLEFFASPDSDVILVRLQVTRRAKRAKVEVLPREPNMKLANNALLPLLLPRFWGYRAYLSCAFLAHTAGYQHENPPRKQGAENPPRKQGAENPPRKLGN